MDNVEKEKQLERIRQYDRLQDRLDVLVDDLKTIQESNGLINYIKLEAGNIIYVRNDDEIISHVYDGVTELIIERYKKVIEELKRKIEEI